MMITDTEIELELVFGPRSSGKSAVERAATSERRYVRSQVQIAEDSKEATGHKLTALEALDAYGLSVLRRVALDGAASLVTKSDEPAATIARRRSVLNLTQKQVADAAGISEGEVQQAETVGVVSPIRTIERISQALALDDRLIGVVTGAGADERLGVRLREMGFQKDTNRFSPSDVLALTEAAWVISKQLSLLRHLNLVSAGSNAKLFRPKLHQFAGDKNYDYPAYERGYVLAAKTRELLGMSDKSAIPSLKSLIENELEVPIVQQTLSPKFAGATISNGRDRGIVVNELGLNANVWIRRMTVAHELGHLLWDPDEKLDQLKVDEYEDLELASNRADPVEIRANAFAVSFLAPPLAVKHIFEAHPSPAETVRQVMQTYGISMTAARHHVGNVIGKTLDPLHDAPQPTDEWVAAENLAVDYFPLRTTPISRRGRFAFAVAASYMGKVISLDTAATLLRTTTSELSASAKAIIELCKPPSKDSPG
jgi:Zn-dependent peptidase ImmA (M78 family)/transcriptional regulator with XRE-family HTH domain